MGKNKKRNSRILPKYLKKEEVKKLIESAENLRDKVALELLYTTGMRVGELSRLRVEDIDFEEGVIVVRGAKGGVDNTLTVPRSTLQDVKFYLGKRKKGRVLWSRQSKGMTVRAIQHMVKKYGEKVGVDVTPHRLRHSHAVHALEAGVPITSVQDQLGHKNLTTTQIYTKIAITDRKKHYEEKNPFEM